MIDTNIINQVCKAGLTWLENNLDNNGRTFKTTSELTAYYKAPLAFRIGKSVAYEKFSEQTFRNFYANRIFKETNLNEDYLNYCPLYRAGWLLIGINYKNIIYQSIFDDFLAHANIKSDFWNTQKQADVLSVTLIGLVALRYKSLDVALKAGKWLINSIERQNSKETFWLRFSSDWQPVIKGSASDISWFEISNSQTKPKTYIAGLLCYFFSELFFKTSDSSWKQKSMDVYSYIEKWNGFS